MARGDNQINLRVKDDLKARVVASAKANNRSINAEIVYQLTVAYRGSYLWVSDATLQQQAELDRMAGNS